MNDVTTAPPPSSTPPTSAPAPASTPAPGGGVEINQNQTDQPSPIGSQAPEKAPSRREAIRAAFERAANPEAAKAKAAEKPAPRPAEAKIGHNKPPEEMPEEDKLDLKKRPSDQPRGERGQFAKRQPVEGETPPAQPERQPGQQPQRQPVRQLPENAPYRDPPQRMAQHAKAEWASVPESVRGEIGRMHQEFDQAYQRYRGDHDTMNSIRNYHDMAEQHGTTLQRALTNYVGMENKLRSDPIAGLDQIVSNLNLRTSDGQKLTLRDVAYYVLNQTPEQLRMTQQGNAQSAASHQIGALHQEVVGLKTALQQMHTAQQFTQTRSAVDVYADSHPRFDELGDLIEQELKFGFDLDTAYRRAERLRPATQAAQTRDPSAQTRNADRSISGSPSVSPSNGAHRGKQDKPVGRREAISNAIKRVNGSL